MDMPSRLDDRGRVNVRRLIRRRKRTKLGSAAGTARKLGRANGVAQQADDLQLRRRDDEAGDTLEAHARARANEASRSEARST